MRLDERREGFNVRTLDSDERRAEMPRCSYEPDNEELSLDSMGGVVEPGETEAELESLLRRRPATMLERERLGRFFFNDFLGGSDGLGDGADAGDTLGVFFRVIAADDCDLR